MQQNRDRRQNTWKDCNQKRSVKRTKNLKTLSRQSSENQKHGMNILSKIMSFHCG